MPSQTGFCQATSEKVELSPEESVRNVLSPPTARPMGQSPAVHSPGPVLLSPPTLPTPPQWQGNPPPRTARLKEIPQLEGLRKSRTIILMPGRRRQSQSQETRTA